MENIFYSFHVTLAFITIYPIINVFAILLNIVEIHLIRKKWKKATHFEVILLNLAIADLLSGLAGLVKTGICIYIYTQNDKSYVLLASACVLMILPVTSSTLFVSIIGVERLLAIKSPLKHRYRASSRRTTFRYIIVTWVLTLSITVGVTVWGTALQGGIHFLMAQFSILALTVGIFLCLAMGLVLFLYVWIGYLVVNRKSWFIKVNKDVEAKTSIIAAIHKERSTLIICILVVASYVALNVPFVVAIFRHVVRNIDPIVLGLNSVTNPLIYFFKGYVDKWCANQKIKFETDVGCGEVKKQKVKGQKKENTAMETNVTVA